MKTVIKEAVQFVKTILICHRVERCHIILDNLAGIVHISIVVLLILLMKILIIKMLMAAMITTMAHFKNTELKLLKIEEE